MTISERLINSLKSHRTSKPGLEKTHVRIKVSGSELSKDTFAIGFDDRPISENDETVELDGLTFVVDANTAKVLADATLDIDREGISIKFDT